MAIGDIVKTFDSCTLSLKCHVGFDKEDKALYSTRSVGQLHEEATPAQIFNVAEVISDLLVDDVQAYYRNERAMVQIEA